MAVKIKRNGKRISEEELLRLEQKIGHSLPIDFREFLKKYSGGNPETNEFEFPDDKGGSGISKFLTLKEIYSEKLAFQDRFIKNSWPFACAEGGNFICIVFGEHSGIYFWDHEFEAEECDSPRMDNMYFLGHTFSEFWKKVRKFDVSQVILKHNQVKRKWEDPDFKPEF